MLPGHVALTSSLNFLALKKKGLKSKHKLSNSLTYTHTKRAIFMSASEELNQARKTEMKPSQLNTS